MATPTSRPDTYIFINHHIAGNLAYMASRAPSIQPISSAPEAIRDGLLVLRRADQAREPVRIATALVRRLLALAADYDMAIDDSDVAKGSQAAVLLQARRAAYTTLAMLVGMDDYLA